MVIDIALLFLFLIACSIPSMKRAKICWQRDIRFMVFVTGGVVDQ